MRGRKREVASVHPYALPIQLRGSVASRRIRFARLTADIFDHLLRVEITEESVAGHDEKVVRRLQFDRSDVRLGGGVGRAPLRVGLGQIARGVKLR